MCETGFDGEICQVWVEKTQRARKVYRCDGCDGRIAVGDLYLNHRSLFDGYWSAERMCAACVESRSDFKKAHPEDLIPVPSGLRDRLQDCIDEGDEESEAKWGPLLSAMDHRKAVANG